MFGKIKDKLKNVFKSSENVIEETEENLENKDRTELNEIEKIENEMLKETKNKDKEKGKIEFSEDEINENKKKIETEIKKEEIESKIIEKEIEKTEKTNNQKIEKTKIYENDEKKSKSFFSKTFDKLKEKKINEEDFEKIWVEFEIFLLEINIAFEIVVKIKEDLENEIIGKSFNRFKLAEKIREILIKNVEEILEKREENLLEKINNLEKPIKIIVLGVNGTGKTTTIAKLVKFFQEQKLKTIVAAADTYRAAALEQLEEHSKKLNFKLIKHKNGSDPAAVAFDAIESAKAKGIDIVLIDTAGRMPNNANLMMELQKVKKVSKADLVLFIGDSIAGNDLLEQIELFDKGINIDGLILTKIDTDERPGSVVSAAYSIEKPIYFLGNGQNYEDLIEFNAKNIAEKLFSIEEE
jgi:fused signal recognition particle receptor